MLYCLDGERQLHFTTVKLYICSPSRHSMETVTEEANAAEGDIQNSDE